MSLRKILVVLGVSLLVGCGRNDRPTIRHVSQEIEAKKTTGKSADSTSGTATAARVEDHNKAGGDAKSGAKTGHAKPEGDAKPMAVSGENPVAASAGKSDSGTEGKQTAKADSPETPKQSEPQKTAAVDAKAAETPDKSASSSPQHVTAPAAPINAIPGVPAAKENTGKSDREVKLGGMQLVAPDSWKRKRPRLKILLAEFSLPADKDNSLEAQVTVTQSITDDPAAVDQLREEIKDEEKSKESTVTHLRIADHDVILVDSTETDDEAARAGSAGEGRYRSLNAMVFFGGSVFYVTCSGPEAIVTAKANEFRDFLQTMKSLDQPR